MFRFLIYVCWQTENKNMLGFVHGCLNQDSRIDKLQKEEASYYEA